MSENTICIHLTKKTVISGHIELKTGMLVGATETGIGIGGIDKAVIRNPISNQPYIPGSSIKGKMRSLLEKNHEDKNYNKILVKVAGDEDNPVRIHKCDEQKCSICKVFGRPAESSLKPDKTRLGHTRLIVRDASLAGYIKDDKMDIGANGIKYLAENRNMALPFTEAKTEVVIDRITSRATPRTFERVPAGTVFYLELVLNVFEGDDEEELLGLVFEGLKLVQDDYIGGQGSRGYGQVKFHIKEKEFHIKENREIVKTPDVLKSVF